MIHNGINIIGICLLVMERPPTSHYRLGATCGIGNYAGRMTFLPVVERELRVAARRRGTYWSRFTAATIGAGLAAFTLLSVTGSNADIGADLFAVVGAVVFLYAAFAGTLATCDCLSEEKREGTLGLLFLTDLKGRDVVLGKLAATSLNVFYGMLAVLPMLAIPFVLGGVTHAEMLRVVLVSINLLVFFLGIGLFVSSLCRQDNWALGLSSLIALALVVAGPLASQIPRFPFPAAALFSSPACACFLAFDDVYNAKGVTLHPSAFFWGNVALTHLYAWVFFWLACWIVPRSWQDAAVGKRARWREGTRSIRSARRRAELLEINPFFWRVARSGRKRLLVWLALVASALFFILCFHWFSADFWDAGADFFLLLPLGLLLKVWLAAEAGRTFSEDRRGGGLELLLSTPLSERQIVRGQLLALWRQFAVPAGLVLLANLVFVLVEMRKWGNTGDRNVLLAMHLVLGGFLVADLIALSWVGMWQGLIRRKPNRAALLSLARILALPPLLFVLGFWFWAIGHDPASGKYDTQYAFTFWILLGLGADLYFALLARRKLFGQFRAIVGRRPRAKTSRGTRAASSGRRCRGAMSFLSIAQRELRVTARRASTFICARPLPACWPWSSSAFGCWRWPWAAPRSAPPARGMFTVLVLVRAADHAAGGGFSGLRQPERGTAGRNARSFIFDRFEGIRCGAGQVHGRIAQRLLRVAGRFSRACPVPAGGRRHAGGSSARTCLALVNVLFFSVAAALWVSARSRFSYRAMSGSLCLIVTWIVAAGLALATPLRLLAALSPFEIIPPGVGGGVFSPSRAILGRPGPLASGRLDAPGMGGLAFAILC